MGFKPRPKREVVADAAPSPGGHRRVYPRRDRPRARTIRAPKRIKVLPEDLSILEETPRPRTRGECPTERPCPWVSCKYHLYVDMTAAGNLKLNFPDLEPWELEQSCALDVADGGSTTLEEVGRLTNLTRERVRQIEARALARLIRRGDARAFLGPWVGIEEGVGG